MNSPQKGKYLVHNFFLYWYLKISDCFFKIFFSDCKSNIFKNKKNPQKILLSNGAHLGDVFLSLYMVSLIKKDYPDIKIGFICGSWSSSMLKQCSSVDYIHTVDHWKLNRSNKNIISKFYQYYQSRKKALLNIKKLKYDVAIELYYSYPNNILLMRQGGIPVEIGYESGGNGVLLTQSFPWKNEDKHVLKYNYELVKPFLKNVVFNAEDFNMDIHPYIVHHTPNLLVAHGIKSNDYVILHLGSGANFKEWPLVYWRQVLLYLLSKKIKIVFTGIGDKENSNILEVSKGYENSIVNLCNRLATNELFQVIESCSLFIGVDSFAGHIAAAYKVKQISIFHGVTNDKHWRPFNSLNIMVKNRVECSPCFFDLKKCKDNLCITGIKPEQVIGEISKFVE